jgi:hypothetical protein
MLNMWIFSTEPKGKTYEELIDLAAKLCTEFILIRRDRDQLNENVENLLTELNEFKIEEKEQQSWPGTRTTEYVIVYYFKLNNISKELLKKYSKSLYSWVEPKLLQDLCFLREERKPWIVNIAHEQFSYIENSDEEDINKLRCINGIQLEEI